jgi:hypothetical protein
MPLWGKMPLWHAVAIVYATLGENAIIAYYCHCLLPFQNGTADVKS